MGEDIIVPNFEKKILFNLEKALYSNKAHWINIILVSVNALFIWSRSFPSVTVENQSFFHYSTYVFLIIFTIEIAFKLLLKKRQFFDRPGDPLALVVILMCWTLNNPYFSVLLAFNILRAFHLTKYMPRGRQIITALERALPSIFNIIFIITLIFSIFAILGNHLFSLQNPEYFGTVSNAFVTLSQIMVGDDWGNLLRNTIQNYPYAWVYYFTFLILITFVFLNAFVGVIVRSVSQEFDVNDLNKNSEELIKIQNALESLKREIEKLSK